MRFIDIYIYIYIYINGFLKGNISKKTSYMVGNKKISGKTCILNLRNERKRVKEDRKENGQDYN